MQDIMEWNNMEKTFEHTYFLQLANESTMRGYNIGKDIQFRDTDGILFSNGMERTKKTYGIIEAENQNNDLIFGLNVLNIYVLDGGGHMMKLLV